MRNVFFCSFTFSIGDKKVKLSTAVVVCVCMWPMCMFDECIHSKSKSLISGLWNYRRPHTLNAACTHVYTPRFSVGIAWRKRTKPNRQLIIGICQHKHIRSMLKPVILCDEFNEFLLIWNYLSISVEHKFDLKTCNHDGHDDESQSIVWYIRLNRNRFPEYARTAAITIWNEFGQGFALWHVIC